ncbi:MULTISPECIES: hypothetical protein [Bartonella]|uniref:Uncharacterized protein n=1 Tax=Bartonella chomelii TaxID=236402 RepID=A0ABR6E2H4_9HYPH|nr:MULTISPECIES: hypothetical protein [Bartonella]MBA9082757.1 hypothetical protein [Bartonella chomelii]
MGCGNLRRVEAYGHGVKTCAGWRIRDAIVEWLWCIGVGVYV